jgi:hypothetical protein
MFFVRSDSQQPTPAESEHTEKYCSDITCGCHYDVTYHGEVTGLQEPSEEELSEALKFWDLVSA